MLFSSENDHAKAKVHIFNVNTSYFLNCFPAGKQFGHCGEVTGHIHRKKRSIINKGNRTESATGEDYIQYVR